MKQLVIFDLDGTLVDTIHDLAEACNHALQQSGFPTHHVSTYQFYVGNGVTRLIERALPAEAVCADTVANVRTHFMEYYIDHLTHNSRPYEGITQLLDDLCKAGVAVAVSSNKYQEATRKLVTALFPSTPWVAIEGQKPNVNVKPDPSIIFEILSKHPTPKSDVLLVGDSAVDIETARRACVESVGVTWGFRPQSELVEAGADHIVDRPSQILTLI